MTKKRSIASQNSDVAGETGGKKSPFLNYTLTDDERKHFQDWRETLEFDELNDKMESLVDKGYSFSIKWDAFNECYSCFIVSPKPDNGADNVILTGRGKSVLSALAGALFRHYMVFDGFWPEITVYKRATDDD